MTTTLEAPPTTTTEAPPAPQPSLAERARAVPIWAWSLVVLVIWIVLYALTKNHDTLVLGGTQTTKVHDWLTDKANDLASSTAWPVHLLQEFGTFLNWLTKQLQYLISVPKLPSPIPVIGWTGVLAIAVWVALSLAGWRMAVLTGLSFLSFAVLGVWSPAMDTLIITGIVVVAAVAIGLPLAVWMGNSRRATAVITPVLDVMQTMPGYVYLLPVVIFFTIGAAPGIVASFIFAIPPVIKIAAHGIRTVSEPTIEATTSMGQTTMQRITKVQLPMARSTVITGVNQTTLAALSMATIAAFVNSPGLGIPVVDGLTTNNVGEAFVPGIAIVIVAIMLDRVTTAVSERSEQLRRVRGGNRRARWATLGVLGVVVVVTVYLSRTYLWAANVPSGLNAGAKISDGVQNFVNWITDHFSTVTEDIRDAITNAVLNPLQNLLSESPWWLAAVGLLAFALVIGGRKAVIPSVICLVGIYYMDLWNFTMQTLASVLVATVLVMILGVIFGVWMGRSRRVDLILRPVLDAGQTMPPFVYLIPALALFSATRFTAIVAAVVYAAPAAIKLVADGIRNVAPTTIEAAESAGTTTRQMITKVQLPMARGALTLATNQGLLFVLSMVAIGGGVGSGALGYVVTDGFRNQLQRGGRGLAAGICLVLLGVMLDRITRAAADRRTGKAARTGH
jgi:glycine betaine/proline transport system permease protein